MKFLCRFCYGRIFENGLSSYSDAELDFKESLRLSDIKETMRLRYFLRRKLLISLIQVNLLLAFLIYFYEILHL